jgi:hypothetical protein
MKQFEHAIHKIVSEVQSLADRHFLFSRNGRKALETYPAVVFRGRIDLPDLTGPATLPAAASDGFSQSVYSPRNGNQPETHAHVGC